MNDSFLDDVAVEPTARRLALAVLGRSADGQDFAQDLLHAAFAALPVSPQDRRLAMNLTLGVIRRRGTLDGLLRGLASRSQRETDPVLWNLLRLGAYQLIFLTHVPAYAAINETVELAGRLLHPGLKGFANGLLRGLTRLLTDEYLQTPAPDALPLAENRYRRLTRAVLPDPANDPVEYAVVGLSLPRWLAKRWLDRLGRDDLFRLGFWFAGPAPLWLRVNRLKTDRESFLAALAGSGVKADAGGPPTSVRLLESETITDLPGYDAGWFAVQDASAAGVAAALAPPPGSEVLDVCSAPGGKTTHLAELMNNQGRIVACDVEPERLRVVSDLARRLGHTIIEPVLLDGRREEPPPAGPFDFVLADVPCSNTGVLGRRPEARWRLDPNDFRNLIPLQTRLLLVATDRVRVGGAVVYSTCSIEPEENEAVVRAVLRSRPGFELAGECHPRPGQPADGGYWAKLVRTRAGEDKPISGGVST